jgi:transcriptional regulator with XRE-family HTH domain
VATVTVERKVEAANRTELAKALGLSRTYVSQVLGGQRDPALSVARRVAKEIGLTVEDFAGYLESKAVN